ncbi:uncharacterized protein LOC111251437 isoform X2 [Varroa destructor]|uniref:Uncharacterized protein n=1 Tax=Varroa destructor TaxID=109461 RepID=A0A7M7KA10_VARDE|nr:uncharacterized protein LOC111251437 isoform X2 [Varroa destructor]
MLIYDFVCGDLQKRMLAPAVQRFIGLLISGDPNFRACKLFHTCLHLVMLYKVFQVTIVDEVSFYQWAEVSPLHHYQTTCLAFGALFCFSTHCLAIVGLPGFKLDLLYHECWFAVIFAKVVYYTCAIVYDAVNATWELLLLSWALLLLTPEAFAHFLSLVYLNSKILELHF